MFEPTRLLCDDVSGMKLSQTRISFAQKVPPDMVESMVDDSSPRLVPRVSGGGRKSTRVVSPASDRSLTGFVWYRLVQGFFATVLAATTGIRASGRDNIPQKGSVLLVSNHLSHLDVLILGILLDRPLNYVARSSLFFFPLGRFIRSVGAFPINRDGMGAEGFKETLRRIKAGGIVTLFPEGTRTEDGDLGEIKSGIARLVARSRAVVVPAAIAGSFEAWPKTRWFPLVTPPPGALRHADQYRRDGLPQP